LAAVRLRADRDTQVINVYRAMGGGWVDISNSMTANPASAVAAQDAAETPNTASN